MQHDAREECSTPEGCQGQKEGGARGEESCEDGIVHELQPEQRLSQGPGSAGGEHVIRFSFNGN